MLLLPHLLENTEAVSGFLYLYDLRQMFYSSIRRGSFSESSILNPLFAKVSDPKIGISFQIG